MAIAAVLIAGCHSPPTPETGTRKNVLLITIDTLRADHVGSYGYHLETSPTMDRLAAEGVRFADATVQWPKTWPAMASMLTATYPATNGIRVFPRRPLPAVNLTMAEVLRSSGYQTGAVVANVNLGKKFAFDQGFDHFVESWVDEVIRMTGQATFENAPGKVKRFTNATIVTDQGIEVLDRLAANPEKPYFLWLHFMDPHGPYLPPAAYEGLFSDAHRRQLVVLKRVPKYQRQEDPKTGAVSNDLGFYKAQYDREIRYFDDELGRFLEALEKRGMRENTLIVLTADHGESLDEHRYFLAHGKLPYQPTASVPFLMVLEGSIPAGKVVSHPVGLIDMLPTVLELLNLPLPPQVQGESLMPLVAGRSRGSPHVFLESGYADPPAVAVRRDKWKLVHYRAAKEARSRGVSIELFDLADDPGEQHNLASAHPEIVEDLLVVIDDWKRTTPGFGEDGGTIEIEDLDERTKEMMRALGYLK
jgi:arylsulfatase A-like enzyme